MSQKPKVKFRLFVAGNAHNSTQALGNLLEYSRTHLPDQHEIEVVDVFRDPERAQTEGVLMTPTLIKYSPLPVRKIIGTLSTNLHMALSLGSHEPANRAPLPKLVRTRAGNK